MTPPLGRELEEQVIAVLDRWDRRLETAAAAWLQLSPGEQQRREAELDAAGETDEWIVVLANWWNEAPLAEQAELRSDMTVLAQALWAAAADGLLDAATDDAAPARNLLQALERMDRIVAVDPAGDDCGMTEL